MRFEENMFQGKYLKWKKVHEAKLKQPVFLLSNDFL